MASVVRERMQKLMDEQKAEAPLPTSRAVMDFGEQKVDAPETPEPEQQTEEMPLPAEAATDAPESPDEPDDLPVEREELEAEERDVEPQEQPEEVPLPETAPTEQPEPTDAPVDQSVDGSQLEVPEGEESVERPDPEWDDAIDDMARQYGGDETEEYQPAQTDWSDEMGWQHALADRSNSF